MFVSKIRSFILVCCSYSLYGSEFIALHDHLSILKGEEIQILSPENNGNYLIRHTKSGKLLQAPSSLLFQAISEDLQWDDTPERIALSKEEAYNSSLIKGGEISAQQRVLEDISLSYQRQNTASEHKPPLQGNLLQLLHHSDL